MFIVKYRKVFYILSAVMLSSSLIVTTLWGLIFGIDFTGGSISEIKFASERPNIVELEQRVLGSEISAIQPGGVVLQPSGTDGLLVRLPAISEEEHQKLLVAIAGNVEKSGIEELRFESIGPVIGRELERKSLIAISLVLAMILVFISWSFRGVARPVASWKYGLVAIIALAHDIVIPIGSFAVLGEYAHAEVGTLFVTALLTILGFSVYDTIVVFDRIRENLGRFGKTMAFQEIVGKSLNEVVGRSLATSFVLILVLSSLLIFGEPSIKHFILTLLIGIIAGTYSSIFLASPLIVTWESFSKK